MAKFGNHLKLKFTCLVQNGESGSVQKVIAALSSV
jgi:hypothetical protein